MVYYHDYDSYMGKILISADNIGITGLWFYGQKYFPVNTAEEKYLPVFDTAKKWLDIYFSGKEPDFSVPLHLAGTDFQMEVWEILLTIPYGKTMTYGTIANKIAGKRKIPRMSAQAVGGAVGRNPVSIIVPCHRVVGADGSMTGYAGGIDKKKSLLKLEGHIL